MMAKDGPTDRPRINSDRSSALGYLRRRVVDSTSGDTPEGQRDRESSRRRGEFTQDRCDTGELRKVLRERTERAPKGGGSALGQDEQDYDFDGDGEHYDISAPDALQGDVHHSGGARQAGIAEGQGGATESNYGPAFGCQGGEHNPELESSIADAWNAEITDVIALAARVSPITASKLRKDRETMKRRQDYVDRIDSLLARLRLLDV